MGWRSVTLVGIGAVIGAVGSTLIGRIRVRTRCPHCHEPIRIEKLPWQLVPSVVADQEDVDEERSSEGVETAPTGTAPAG